MVKDGGSGSNFALPPGREFVVIRLDRRRLEALTRVFRGGADEPLDRLQRLHRLPGSALDGLRCDVGALARDELAERIDRVEAAERDVYQKVALALAAPPEPIRFSPEARRRALRRAEEYMWAHAGERISLGELCLASECSERTLRYVFHERYGVSPMALLKRLRLQGLRRDLRDAAPRSTTVLDLALRWGFWHLGHLGRDYKSFFGETPAATLARTTRRSLQGVSVCPSPPMPFESA
jgi:AraC-like DNA-binding protein